MSKLDPSKLSDEEFDDLQAKVDHERTVRETRRKEEALAKNRAFLDRFRGLPSTPLLALFKHDRTSCSDENVCNGWWSNENDQPRCAKCALIETLNGTYPHDKIIVFNLSVSVLEP